MRIASRRQVRSAVCGAVACAALTIPASAGANGAYFVQTSTGPTAAGESPAAIATADFDEDLVPDVAVANARSKDVSVLMGTGDGFARPDDVLPAGNRPSAIAAADLNDDGIADIAVASVRSDDVVISLGTGGGRFAPARRLATGAGPRDLEVADVDGDGKLDLLTVSQKPEEVTVLFGDGVGGSEATVTVPTTQEGCTGDCTDPSSLTVAQLVGDLRPDIAVAETIGGVEIIRNDGNRAFSLAADIEAGTFLREIIAADLNGDGLADLAASDSFAGLGASILLADAGADFRVGETKATEGGFPTSLGAADLDLDGDVDLMITEDEGSLGVLLNRGDGSFAGPNASPAGRLPSAATTADFTADGRPDLAVAHRGKGGVSLFENLAARPKPAPVRLQLGGYSRGKKAFVGRVRSRNDDCLRGVVRLFRVRKGTDAFDGIMGHADAKGRLSLRAKSPSAGTYYAEIERREVVSGRCDAGRSNRITVR